MTTPDQPHDPKVAPKPGAEWLETDGLGGYAMGPVLGPPNRRYHALLVAATEPPVGRMVLVNGVEADVVGPRGTTPLFVHRFGADLVAPPGAARMAAFSRTPWPTWDLSDRDGLAIRVEIFMRHEAGAVVLRIGVDGAPAGTMLRLRPFLSGREDHALHVANEVFRFAPEESPGRLLFRPYDRVPATVLLHDGSFSFEPHWYRDFRYDEEARRGYPAREDLAAPGVVTVDLAAGPATFVFCAEAHEPLLRAEGQSARTLAKRLDAAEKRRRRGLGDRRRLAADAFLVRRDDGRSIIAGYPWFTDWGRDTFIALRGLCLATKRLAEASDVLLAWAGHVSEGMLPNRFPDHGATAEYNAVDASLWYVVAANEWFERSARRGRAVKPRERAALEDAIHAILDGYSRGTRHGIRVDVDGLLQAGEAGVQLTWMDAKIDDQVVTPRTGKPVELQALWINALELSASFVPEAAAKAAAARAAFLERFVRADAPFLYDVVDVDHVPGTADAAVRPNQLFAVGGLPRPILDGRRARRLVDAAFERLWTPAGPRSLAPNESGYCAHYEGDPRARDLAYHQGTVWPWLAGPFIEAWVRSRGGTAAAKTEARRRWLAPLLARFEAASGGHLPELADAEAPHAARGCPFQAWSLGEALRLDLEVLADASPES